MTIANRSLSLATSYKGFTIEPETEPWAIKYGNNFRFFREGDEVINQAKTIDLAKIEIENKLYDELERLNSREKFILSLQDDSVWPALIQKEWETKLEDVRREQKEIYELIKA